jgi:rod shape determining protein RodA
MRINRRLLLSFDWLWFLSMLLLSGAGLLAIWSTTEGTNLNSYYGRQFLYLCIALLVFLILLYFDYHLYSDYITLTYITGFVLLAVVLFAGRNIHNNRSWLGIGFGTFAFQPSEFIKLLVIVALAKYYSEADHDTLKPQDLFMGGLIVLAPMFLVILQGDLGTAITFLPVYVVLSYLGGIKKKYLLIILLVIAVATPFSWMMLRDYQKGRIKTVLNPSEDPHGLGYQTIQSEIAIGSGKFLGKGLKRGTQGQLGFLPARHTDFVFAVLSEETGFVGGITVLSLFLLVSIRMLRAASEAKDKIGMMTIAGVLALFLFHVAINIGMVLGRIPVAGIPLPFVSAGGSSLISFFAAMAICLNIRMRRYVN